ncbi:uncharacterized protein [Henckelia pumila]|uniref:uncharacterized protein isoform X2 n=1 Tax=Henckelia pumila TaxID=405737 RepID=UPI003C6E7A1A
MKAMMVKKRLFSRILERREVKVPKIKENEVLIKVCAVGVNRGDIIDVAKGVDGVCPGLECSGIIEAVGRNVNCWKIGQRVCAILEGGGYAEKVAVPASFLLPLPDNIDLDDAAGLPYASCTLLLALFKLHDPKTSEKKIVLIREGTSAIGVLAIQYAKYMGFTVIASTGVDLVLDYEASDLHRNIQCCRHRGKVVIVDLHGTKSTLIDLSILQLNHVEIKVVDLRSKDLGYKNSLIIELRTHLWAAVLQQKVVPAIKLRFPVIESQTALDILRDDDSSGKIVVCMNFEQNSGHLKMS